MLSFCKMERYLPKQDGPSGFSSLLSGYLLKMIGR